MPLAKAALLKTTLLDYPGEVASILFTPGCNLRCPYCHNSSLVKDPYGSEDLQSISKLKEFLVKRQPLLGAVVISGGEPLLYEGTKDLVDFIKNLGLKVKIDTNGLYPERLRKLNVDYIAMDIKTTPDKYYLLGATKSDYGKILESIDYIISSGIDHEFRTTVSEDIITESDVEKLTPLLKKCDKWFFTPFIPGNNLDPSYRKKESPSKAYMEKLNRKASSAGIRSSIR